MRCGAFGLTCLHSEIRSYFCSLSPAQVLAKAGVHLAKCPCRLAEARVIFSPRASFLIPLMSQRSFLPAPPDSLAGRPNSEDRPGQSADGVTLHLSIPNKEVMRNQRCKAECQPRKIRSFWLVWLLVVSGLLTACGNSSATSPAAPSGEQMKRYPLKGRVIETNAKTQRVVIAHEDIPNYMEAMTMPFTLLDDKRLRELKRGDGVNATLVFDEQTNRSWLENVVVIETQKQGADQSAAAQ